MGIATVDGKRVSLRPIRDDDVASIEVWMDEARATAWSPYSLPLSRRAGKGRSVGAETSGVLVIDRTGENGQIGIVEYEATDDWLTMRFIALAKAYRGWGYGSEAVRLLEDWAAREGLGDRSRAEVSVRNGLGLYFWLRLGYRPGASVDDGRDAMTMIREIEAGER